MQSRKPNYTLIVTGIVLAAVVLLAALFYALLAVPFEAAQGPVQKIFYFHVPSAFAMYFFAVLGVVLSVLYLNTKKIGYDYRAQAAMRVSLMFALMVIISGPIWAKPIWGVFWTWDPRLTLTFVVFLILVSYVLARRSFRERGLDYKGSQVGSILAILAVPMMVLTHLSVKIWRGLHPSVLRNPEGLTPEFAQALQAMIVGVFLLGGVLFFLQARALELEGRIQDQERSSNE